MTLRLALLLLAPLLARGAEVDFAHEVAPILRRHCAECHLGEKRKGGLSMNTRESLLEGGENGAVIVPGKPADSRLHALVIAPGDDDDRMPPPDSGKPALIVGQAIRAGSATATLRILV